MRKYYYNFRIKATPGTNILPSLAQEMPTLRQALDYLEPLRRGTVTTFATVRDETGVSTVVRASIEFKDTIGRNDAEIWNLFDKNIDARLMRSQTLTA